MTMHPGGVLVTSPQAVSAVRALLPITQAQEVM